MFAKTEIEDKKGYYHLDEDVIVYTKLGKLIAPRGFYWNLASCPGWSRVLGFSKGDPKTLLASLFHDLLYYFKPFTREQTDRLYYDLCLMSGFPKWKAKIEYMAVRIAGGSYWNNDSEDIKLINKWVELWKLRPDFEAIAKILKIP